MLVSGMIEDIERKINKLLSQGYSAIQNDQKKVRYYSSLFDAGAETGFYSRADGPRGKGENPTWKPNPAYMLSLKAMWDPVQTLFEKLNLDLEKPLDILFPDSREYMITQDTYQRIFRGHMVDRTTQTRVSTFELIVTHSHKGFAYVGSPKIHLSGTANGNYWESGHYNVVDDPQNLPRLIREYQHAEEQLIRQMIIPGKDILEVGCGTGRILGLLEADAKRIVGIDHAVKMIEKSKTISSKAELVHADALSMPFGDMSFDYILCLFNTVGNFSHEPIMYLREMRRVVRVDGQVIVSVYSENALDAQLEFYRKIGLTVDKITANAVFLKEGFESRRFAKSELEKMLKDAELTPRVATLTPISHVAIGTA